MDWIAGPAQPLWLFAGKTEFRCFEKYPLKSITRPTAAGATVMCRSIKPLFNFAPPVTDEEIRAASLQFVRKVSGFSKPSRANEAAFLAAVEQIAAVSTTLLHSLITDAEPKNRDEEAAKARLRYVQRFPA
jgi:hypothetical protein